MPDKIDVNAASEEELVEVLEIDEALADEIAEHRARAGGIQSIDELARLPGVNAALLQKMRDRLIIEAPLGAPEHPGS